MKKLLILFFYLASLNLYAWDPSTIFFQDGIYYHITDSEAKTVEVTIDATTGYRYEGDIIIPKSVTDYKGVTYSVTRVSEMAFTQSNGLTSVYIPNSVTSIGAKAFWYCQSLISVNIPEGVTKIEDLTFSECRSLKSIYIPDGVTSIGRSAFNYCGNLTSINIPESVTSIGDGAFSGCYILKSSFVNNSSLTGNWGAILYDEETDDGLLISENVVIKCRDWAKSVIIPNYVTNIGFQAFGGCSNLISVRIPSSVTTIEGWAFCGCTVLTSINIPEGVTYIEDSTFRGCSALTSINIPEGVTYIGRYAFAYCDVLNNIKIPGGVKVIYNSTFSNCSALSSIVIPEGVTDIEEYAFNGCTNLTSITIPQNVSSIGAQAYSGCKLRNLLIKCLTPPFTTTSAFTEQTYYHTTLYVPTDCWDTYAYDDNWYKFSNIREVTILENQVSEQLVYTLMDARSFEYSVYDPINDCVGTLKSVAGINEDNPNHSWQIIEASGSKYLYNLGAKKYVYNGLKGLELSESPIPIEMKDGENGIIFGGQTEKQWALVTNESMNMDKAIITSIIPLLPIQNTNNLYFDLNGRKQYQPQKGINIIRMSDGAVKKVQVK